MKIKNLLSFLAIILSQISFAQITIYSSDLGEVNDTVRYSHASSFNATSFENTDTNFFWDFSMLIPNTQSMDEYKSINSTNFIYRVAFFGKADLVSPRPDMAMAGVVITNSYNFYNKSSNDYRLVGYGGETSGSKIPVVFTNPDIIYRFPMSFGNIDSNTSNWDINVPGTGYIEEMLHRVNTVDGWGVIKTPYGQFNCIRIKSVVHQEDSVYLASSGIGLRIPQNYTEYTWFAKNMNFPIMKATVPQSIIGQIDVIYMDSIRQFVGIDNSLYCPAAPMIIAPNPASDYINIKLSGNQKTNITIYSSNGKIVFRKRYLNNQNINIQTQEWARGIYFINYNNNKHNITKKLVLQ